MRQKFYIADCHFGHGNLNIKMDHRGFQSPEEMDNYMIQQWNKKVHAGDEVYILGDLIWKHDKDDIPHFLNQLHGKKYLIIGNHDKRWLGKYDNEKHGGFHWIKDYAEIKDNKRTVILFHYPILTYNHQFNDNTWMLHGHVHWTDDQMLVDKYKDIAKQSSRFDSNSMMLESPNTNIINCFCMTEDYQPLTLDEWIDLEQSGEIKKRMKEHNEKINIS